MTRVPQNIGWTKVEIIYLKAAMTLGFYEGICALEDIASISGRTISALRAKMTNLAEAEKLPTKRVLVPAKPREGSAGRPRCPTSEPFRWPSREALRGGRAALVKSRAAVELPSGLGV